MLGELCSTTKTQEGRGVGCFDERGEVMGKVRQRETNARQKFGWW